MIWLSRESNSHSSVIMLEHKYNILNFRYVTYDESSFDWPPATIVKDPEVIALWIHLAWAKFPIFFQFPSLYSAIVDMRLGEPSVSGIQAPVDACWCAHVKRVSNQIAPIGDAGAWIPGLYSRRLSRHFHLFVPWRIVIFWKFILYHFSKLCACDFINYYWIRLNVHLSYSLGPIKRVT